MQALPDELLADVILLVDLPDIVNLQLVCQRFRRLARDDRIWREQCFMHSRIATAALRHNTSVPNVGAGLAALRAAVINLPIGAERHSVEDNIALSSSKRSRALASWDPKFPGEDLDYHAEYIHRHAPRAPVAWLPMHVPTDDVLNTGLEATGVGLIRDAEGLGQHIVAPFDDGSVCIFSTLAASAGRSSTSLALSGRSSAGMLSTVSGQASADHSKSVMTDVGALDCVSIDSSRYRGYFAVQDRLNEVDLKTLQLVSTQTFPFPISALSAIAADKPIMVGTSWTIHEYDPRISRSAVPVDSATRCDLIGGAVTPKASLPQSGPLSILHEDKTMSTWVAGRFTHLLKYDRRFFPTICTTIHSGARISSLSSSPYPMLGRYVDFASNPNVSQSDILAAKTAGTSTLMAAGVYKGKGSLELYSLDSQGAACDDWEQSSYKNRQTAAASKLLSITPHGGMIAVSDSDGHIRWFERNGRHLIRSTDVNDDAQLPEPPSLPAWSGDLPSWNMLQSEAQRSEDLYRGDIVQKMMPFHSNTRHSSEGMSVAQNPLVLQTGDGRIGILGFGHRPPYKFVRTDDGYDSGPDAQRYTLGDDDDGDDELTPLERDERLDVRARRAAEVARRQAEQRYAGEIRRALQDQANELRWMTGLGLG